jgi:putative methyltransferase
VLKLAVTRHKARLGAEFTKTRIRYAHATLDAFREAVSNGGLEAEDGAPKARHPRWVRVNTIKTTLDQQLATTFAGFKKVDDIADVRMARGTAKLYYEDPNIPNLLALPSKMNLSRSAAYTKGELIFQDKASCFPAYLLDLSPDDGDVIDGCAAPGNKTTHLAAMVAERGHAQKVVAFERDKVRSSILHKMVKLAGADKIVTVKGSSDFLATTPDTNDFASVGAIVLDPSCSGAGIVGRDDAVKMHLPEAPVGTAVVSKAEKGIKRKRGEEAKVHESSTLTVDLDDTDAEETPVDGKLSERLATLSRFQLHILTHAMRFKNARKITYSTCSIHFEENEGVVLQALASSLAKKRGWKILERKSQVDGLRMWGRRGVWEEGKLTVELDQSEREDILDSCIRCDKDTSEGTMGFFVAAFVRGDPQEPTATVANAHVGDDEWNGFSDADGNEGPTRGEDAGAEVSKKLKKKKRKHHADCC